jgi:hypothetical protein
MRGIIGIAVLALTASQAAAAAPTTLAQIEQMERDRQKAFVDGDIAKLDRETADDYSTITGSGKISTKPQMMANLRAGKTKVESVTLNDLRARVYGDTAVLTGRYDDVHVTDGVRSEAHALFTRIFVRTKGRWQAVAYQQTNLPAK